MKKAFQILLLMLIPLAVVEVALRVAGIGGSIIYDEDPACGYRPRPGQRFATMGTPIEILADGFRGPAARTNLLFLGDSVTYGTAYVKDADTFPALLGGANGGVNGWGLQNVARFLEGPADDAFPTVVWTIPTCDVLRPFMTLRSGLISTNRRMWFRLEYLLRFIWYGHIRTQPAPNDPTTFEANQSAVLTSAAALKQQGRRLVLVFLPYRDEALGQVLPETPFAQRLREAATAAGMEILIADPGSDAPGYYRDPAHLTPAGNRWLAGVIRAYLEKQP